MVGSSCLRYDETLQEPKQPDDSNCAHYGTTHTGYIHVPWIRVVCLLLEFSIKHVHPLACTFLKQKLALVTQLPGKWERLLREPLTSNQSWRC